jgi:hypothetical protein
VLSLNGGNHTSFRVDIGRSDEPVDSHFTRTTHGTLVVRLENGLSNLGNSTQVHVLGTGNLTETNGMLTPRIVGSDADGTGTFLTNTPNGLDEATYTSSALVGINSANATMVYDVVGNQTVTANDIAEVYALRVGAGLEVSGSNSTLLVGDLLSGPDVGVILNQGATISVNTLGFGTGNGLIYSSGTGNTISGNITATNLVLFGPGELTLSGTTDVADALRIQSGTVILSGNSTVSAPVTLGDATLVINSGRTISGNLTSTLGTVVLNGGTVTNLTTDNSSMLTGGGTVAGDATLNGAIAPGLAEMTFQGNVTMSGNTMLAWTLGSLVDSTTGTAGEDWTLLTLDPGAGDILDLDGFSFENDFSFLDESLLPNGDDAFWDVDHSWLVIQSSARLAEDGNTFNLTWGIPTYENGQFQWNFFTDNESPYEHQIWLYYEAGPVPEPSAVGMILVSAALFLRRRSRARRTILGRA